MYRFIFCSFQNIFIHWAIYSFLCPVVCVLCLMFHPHSCLHNRLTCRLTFSIRSSTELNHDFCCVIPAALFVATMIYYHTPCLMWGQSVEGVLPDLFWTQSKHNVLFSFFFLSVFLCVCFFTALWRQCGWPYLHIILPHSFLPTAKMPALDTPLSELQVRDTSQCL